MNQPQPATATLDDLRAGRLRGARQLDLGGLGLRELPAEVATLADTLEVLNLAHNALDSLPAFVAHLPRLKVVFGSFNPFTRLPQVLGRCPALETIGFRGCQLRELPGAALPASLRALILTDNQLEALPAAIGACARLQKLMLAGNRLHELPPELARCTALELLRLAANRFERLPPFLLRMPRLAWLACAGNPMDAAREQAALEGEGVRAIDWADLTLLRPLGEGASGVIHLAAWADGRDGRGGAALGAATPSTGRPTVGQAGPPERPPVAMATSGPPPGSGPRAQYDDPPAPRTVALKLFKAALTTDGLPRSEMAASLRAGQHANLIPVEGVLRGHPEGRPGLLMQPIDASFATLARPPSLDTCTRDVYDEALRLSPARAVALAQGVAAAAAHLHAQGLLHGDLYAHNVLWHVDGRCLLGDCGAASLHDPADATLAQDLARLEARAFGFLLEELLAHARAPADEADQARLAALAAMEAACAQPQPAQRPSLAALRDRLAALQPSR